MRKMKKITKRKQMGKWIAIVGVAVAIILSIFLYGMTHQTKQQKLAVKIDTGIEQIENQQPVRYVDISDNNEVTEEIIFYAEENAITEEIEEPVQQEEQRERTQANYQGKYYIKVNCTANTVTIYQNDGSGNYQPIKAMICSTGSATPQSGRYIIGQKYTWLLLFGDVYGHYCTRILTESGKTTHILFHSVPYLRNQDNGSLEYWEFDKLGTSASMGCVRLQIKDTNWIYTNIPKGTLVEFYNDSNPGPLGKPSAPKISDQTQYRDWDPTDPDERNPWLHRTEEPTVENIIIDDTNSIEPEEVFNVIENTLIENQEIEENDISNVMKNDERNTSVEENIVGNTSVDNDANMVHTNSLYDNEVVNQLIINEI